MEFLNDNFEKDERARSRFNQLKSGVERLMKEGHDMNDLRLNQNHETRVTLLDSCIMDNEPLIFIEWLIDVMKADVNDFYPSSKEPGYMITPLKTALRYHRDSNVITLLLEKGADPNLHIDFEFIRDCLESDHIPLYDTVHVFIQHGLRLNENDVGRNLQGVYHGYFGPVDKYKTLKLLFDNGYSPNTRDDYCPLHIYKKLFDREGQWTEPERHTITLYNEDNDEDYEVSPIPDCNPIREEMLPLIKLLIRYGYDLESTINGRPELKMLYSAGLIGSIEVFTELLRAGAKVDPKLVEMLKKEVTYEEREYFDTLYFDHDGDNGFDQTRTWLIDHDRASITIEQPNIDEKRRILAEIVQKQGMMIALMTPHHIPRAHGGNKFLSPELVRAVGNTLHGFQTKKG